jgi:hypothetical protein
MVMDQDKDGKISETFILEASDALCYFFGELMHELNYAFSVT